jgi:hypothetical protein
MESEGNKIEKYVRNEAPSRRIMYRENEVIEGESSQDIMQAEGTMDVKWNALFMDLEREIEKYAVSENRKRDSGLGSRQEKGRHE